MENGSRSSDDLGAATGTHGRSLYRVLRALASVGVFQEDADGRFALTPLASACGPPLRNPWDLGLLYIGQSEYWQAWGHLLDSVRTGEHAFRHAHGINTWEYYERNPEAAAAFDRAMTSRSRRHADAVLKVGDFGRFGCVVDVGGNQGAFLSAILAQHPFVHGVLFDQPKVVDGAAEVLRSAGVTDRCRIVGDDFFDGVPSGGDAYVTRHMKEAGPVKLPRPASVTYIRLSTISTASGLILFAQRPRVPD